jgi:hypothetical protein
VDDPEHRRWAAWLGDAGEGQASGGACEGRKGRVNESCVSESWMLCALCVWEGFWSLDGCSVDGSDRGKVGCITDEAWWEENRPV